MKASNTRFWQTTTLVLVCVGLVFVGFSGYLQPFLGTVLEPVVGVQRWLSVRYLAIYEFITVPRDVASLRTSNEELEREVAGLQTQIIELQQQLREAQVLYALLDFARANPQGGQYTAAEVIGRDPNPFLKYIFIDRGSDHGIRRGMPVITDRGLVGRIDAVTSSAARVQLITDPGSAVNVRMEPDRGIAQIQGSITGEITLEMLSQEIPVQTGDLILSSGLGGNFPPDILIGQVVTVRSKPNELFQSASVQTVVDFNTLQAVLVITNFRPIDISPLVPSPEP